MSDMKRLLSGAYILGYSDARNDKAIDPISAIERLTMNLNKDDTVSRQEAIDAIEHYIDEVRNIPMGTSFKEGVKDGYYRTISIIKRLPSAERTGHWIDYADTAYANCSECGRQIDTHYERGYLNYCPNCGARMMRGDEDESVESL